MSTGKHNIKTVRIDQIDADTSNQIRRDGALKWNEKELQSEAEQRHIAELLAELKTSNKGTRFKKPLQVVINEANPNKPYILTDGFHRFEAYQQHTKRGDYGIPVVVIEGGIEKARLIAHKNNTEPKLIMPKSQIVQSAWERITEGAVDGLTDRDAAQELRVSKSVVNNMRNALKRIREGDLLGEHQPDYGKDGRHLLWRKDIKRALRSGEDFEIPEQEHPVAAEMLKKWREQIIEHAEQGEPEWFLKQAEWALRAALEEMLDEDMQQLRTKAEASIEEPDF